jgi:hypothetical protein
MNRTLLASSMTLAGLFALLGTHCGHQASPPPQPAPSVAAASSAPEPSTAPAPGDLTAADVDTMLRAAWQQAGVEPAPPVDDARFLRRAWLDLLGVVPPPETVTAFLLDPAPDKRARAVQAMLASPRHAEHWTNYWDRVLLGREVRAQLVDRPAFRAWLSERFSKNTPWNQLVLDLVTATGQNRPGDDGPTPGPTDPRVNGAVNWLLRYQNSPADLTGAASRVFLGVQIQCAQCHDHKTEKWKTADFQHLAACFLQTKVERIDRDGKLRRVELVDLDRVPRGGPRRAAAMAGLRDASPAALDGTDFSSSPNRRAALATWMTSPQNPWFARAFVNRIWATMLGRGFVDPVDDLRESNPPVAPELFTKLTDDFVAHGYDLKRLLSLITATEAYQRASAPPRSAEPQKSAAESRLWARFRPSPMGPDELVDSLVAATKIEPLLERSAGGELERIKIQVRKQFSYLFDVDEEQADDDQFDGTIPQALMLLNGRLTNAGSSAVPGAALAEILAMPGDDAARVEALYLRTLSRRPTAQELEKGVAFVTAPRAAATPGPPPDRPARRGKGKRAGGKGGKKAGNDPLERLDKRARPPAGDPRKQAYEDLFWALLNSSEFIFNH